MKQFCWVIFFGSLIPRLLYGQYTFGTYLGCVDFFMYYLECKSTVETLMSGCPVESPSINKSDHPGGWEKVWEYHWQMLIPTWAYCAGCCCTGGRGGATKETGRAPLVVYMVGDTCTRMATSPYLNIAPGHSLDEVYCKTHHFPIKTKN